VATLIGLFALGSVIFVGILFLFRMNVLALLAFPRPGYAS
jgi:hypothetical protein